MTTQLETRRTSKRPAYMVISDQLRAKIEAQELVAGDRLPAERELVDEFGVARMTVRHALALLQDEGIIERRRGRTGGTFVRELPPFVDLNSSEDIADQLSAQDVALTSTVTSSGTIKAPAAVELAFDLDSGTEVYAIETVYAVRGYPIAYETTYTLPSRDPHAYGELHRQDVIAPARPSEREQTRLSVTGNTLLQRITRRVYAGDTLVSFSQISVRPDALQLRTSALN